MKYLVLPLLAVLFSCATKVTGLEKAESFNFNNVKNGKMIVAAVTHSEDKWKFKDVVKETKSFKRQILEERNDLKVADSVKLVKSIGKKNYSKLMKEYDDNGFISDKTKKYLMNKVKGFRYLTFAKVDSDNISKFRKEEDQTDGNGKKTGKTSMVSTVQRNISANINVIDLTDGKNVWSGSIAKDAKATLSYNVKKDGLIMGIVKAVNGTEEQGPDVKYPFPKAPSLKGILAKVYKGFAENLPEED